MIKNSLVALFLFLPSLSYSFDLPYTVNDTAIYEDLEYLVRRILELDYRYILNGSTNTIRQEFYVDSGTILGPLTLNKTILNGSTQTYKTVTFPPETFTVIPWDLDSGTPLNGVYRIRSSDWNFVANSSFEHWTNGINNVPSAWVLQGHSSVTRSNTAVLGSHSAEVTFSSGTDGELYFVYGADDLVDYSYSAYVSKVTGAGTARLVAQQNFGAFTEDVTVDLPDSAGPSLVTLTFSPSATGDYRISFRAKTDSTSTWRFDEVKVQESKRIVTTYTPLFIDDTSNGQAIWGYKNFFGQIRFSSGTAIGPGLAFKEDTSLGFFMPVTSNTIGITGLMQPEQQANCEALTPGQVGAICTQNSATCPTAIATATTLGGYNCLSLGTP